MKADDTRNKSTGLKILSVLMAGMLWLYVVNQSGVTSGKNTVQAELRYYNVPSGLTVAGPRNVAVKLWGSFHEGGEIVAYVDLAGMGKGSHMVPVKVQPVKGAMLATVQPKKVKIVLEQMKERLLPVKIQVKENPPSGYELREITLSPEKCMVIGDRERVNQVAAVTAPLNLGSNNSIGIYKVEIQARDARGNQISKGIKLLPETVQAYAVVEKKKEIKKIAVKPQFKGKLPEGFKLGDVTADPAEVNLLGDKTSLDSITELLTQEIDLADKQESFNQLVNLTVPAGTTASPTQVNVKVTIDKINDKISDKVVQP